MEPSQLSRLMSAINVALDESDHVRALRVVLTNFDRVPDNSPLRERVALILAEEGRKKEAVEIFQAVGRHYANAGYPMRAIAAGKQMVRLNPDTTVLFDHISTLYNIRSPYISQDRRATSFPEPEEELDLSPDTPDGELEELLTRAHTLSIDESALKAQPGDLPSVPLLSLLPQEALRRVMDSLEYDIFSQAQPVIERGRMTGGLVWTVTDDLVVDDQDERLAVPPAALLGLGSFGQAGRPSEVDVHAQSGSEIIRIKREAVREVDDELGDFQNRIATLRRHAMTERLLRRHAMFEDLREEEQLEVIEAFTGMKVSDGEEIIEQNTPSPGLFIILDGQVDIVRNDEDWEITIATLSSGDVFGEIGLIADKPAVAGCLMTKPGHLLHLTRSKFHHLAEHFPSVAKYTAGLAQERLADVSTTLSADDLAEVD